MVGKAAFLERLYKNIKLFQAVKPGQMLEGSSPPSVFIGRYGYPKVEIGPLVPPITGDTREMDLPEAWLPAKKQALDIAQFRLNLIRGKQQVHVRDQSRTTELVREIALAERPTEVEVQLTKPPVGGFFHEDVQPFGPSAPLKELRVDAGQWDPHLERAFYDTDQTAKGAILDLYERGDLPISSIQRGLSVGAFGLGKNRKLVPTRWSITAVDSTLSETFLDQIRAFPSIETHQVYEACSLNNRFLVLLSPGLWRYETLEAFFPQVIGDTLEVFGDFEEFAGRKTYASIGGCYYSARLAVAEKLLEEKKQAQALILREVYEGYIPLGVFNVRENVRQALACPAMEFESWPQALSYALSRLRLPLSTWAAHARTLRDRATQTSLRAFC